MRCRWRISVARRSIEEATPEHPFRLATSPARSFLNSTFTETPGSLDKEKRPEVMIHPEDAAPLGIETGDWVRLKNVRGAVLIREHDPAPELFVLRQGMMMTYRLLDDGSRQILRFLFPGDVIGVGMLAYTAATETVAALADSIVHPIDRARVVEFAVAHPRLLLAFCAIDQAERAAMTDRMTGVGRMNAKARIAAVLLDLRDRQRHGHHPIGRGRCAGSPVAHGTSGQLFCGRSIACRHLSTRSRN